ncbi:unnamed protein product [Amoebophrya sp. A120]|nr:unnamed protein product [Amoebophrya sp. A120]|eukprot:GSA120T00004101001.1
MDGEPVSFADSSGGSPNRPDAYQYLRVPDLDILTGLPICRWRSRHLTDPDIPGAAAAFATVGGILTKADNALPVSGSNSFVTEEDALAYNRETKHFLQRMKRLAEFSSSLQSLSHSEGSQMGAAMELGKAKQANAQSEAKQYAEEVSRPVAGQVQKVEVENHVAVTHWVTTASNMESDLIHGGSLARATRNCCNGVPLVGRELPFMRLFAWPAPLCGDQDPCAFPYSSTLERVDAHSRKNVFAEIDILHKMPTQVRLGIVGVLKLVVPPFKARVRCQDYELLQTEFHSWSSDSCWRSQVGSIRDDGGPVTFGEELCLAFGGRDGAAAAAKALHPYVDEHLFSMLTMTSGPREELDPRNPRYRCPFVVRAELVDALTFNWRGEKGYGLVKSQPTDVDLAGIPDYLRLREFLGDKRVLCDLRATAENLEKLEKEVCRHDDYQYTVDKADYAMFSQLMGTPAVDVPSDEQHPCLSPCRHHYSRRRRKRKSSLLRRNCLTTHNRGRSDLVDLFSRAGFLPANRFIWKLVFPVTEHKREERNIMRIAAASSGSCASAQHAYRGVLEALCGAKCTQETKDTIAEVRFSSVAEARDFLAGGNSKDIILVKTALDAGASVSLRWYLTELDYYPRDQDLFFIQDHVLPLSEINKLYTSVTSSSSEPAKNYPTPHELSVAYAEEAFRPRRALELRKGAVKALFRESALQVAAEYEKKVTIEKEAADAKAQKTGASAKRKTTEDYRPLEPITMDAQRCASREELRKWLLTNVGAQYEPRRREEIWIAPLQDCGHPFVTGHRHISMRPNVFAFPIPEEDVTSKGNAAAACEGGGAAKSEKPIVDTPDARPASCGEKKEGFVGDAGKVANDPALAKKKDRELTAKFCRSHAFFYLTAAFHVEFNHPCGWKAPTRIFTTSKKKHDSTSETVSTQSVPAAPTASESSKTRAANPQDKPCQSFKRERESDETGQADVPVQRRREDGDEGRKED